jgi:hypothetical protein
LALVQLVRDLARLLVSTSTWSYPIRHYQFMRDAFNAGMVIRQKSGKRSFAEELPKTTFPFSNRILN